ncbi:hypothetical protein NUW58_g1249 [Xylaria curta]|uniref:Uncharacterized protein n=1 Tax=Xylaria curta TaxID=42375 RepID=A0ACC1PPC0_9PEZI|nr:hypothetical protein NUW58_g1249 [Xylaria curta]
MRQSLLLCSPSIPAGSGADSFFLSITFASPKMLQRVLLAAAFYGGLVSAGTVTFVSSTTASSCSYKLGSGGVPPTPIPTSTTTSITTKVSTNATVTVPPIVTITAPLVTSTLYTSITYFITVPTVTIPVYTSYIQAWKTIATGTFADTICANGAKPTTVTKSLGGGDEW